MGLFSNLFRRNRQAPARPIEGLGLFAPEVLTGRVNDQLAQMRGAGVPVSRQPDPSPTSSAVPAFTVPDFVATKTQSSPTPDVPLPEPNEQELVARLRRTYGAGLANRVMEAADHFNYTGPLTPEMVQIIADEGFSAGTYKDDSRRKVETQGVGQTGNHIGKNFFTEVYPEYVERARRLVSNYDEMPASLRSAVLSGVYRGDLGPKTAKLLEEERWEEAAAEYLDHAEYRRRLKNNPKDGVVVRMRRNQRAMLDMAAESKA